MDFEDHVLQQRLVGLLRSRQRYRRDGAKNLATDIGCTERTAKNILAGHWPRATHLRRIVGAFGRDAWEALFAPDIDETRARLAMEVRALEQQLEAKLAALAGTEVRSFADSRSESLASHEDGAAVTTP